MGRPAKRTRPDPDELDLWIECECRVPHGNKCVSIDATRCARTFARTGRVPTRTGLTPSTRAAMQSSVTIDLTKPDALTHESVARLLASATDRTNTQLRVTKEGVAFISSTDVGADRIDGLAFRLETFSAGGDHVGPAAAQDPEWVNRIYEVLKDNWPRPSSSYIDLF
jgi:hypothetical protein